MSRVKNNTKDYNVSQFFTVLTLVSLLLFGTISCSDNSTGTEPDPKEPESISQVDTAVNSFMSQYSVPGLSVAITKDGNLVYAKSYGHADAENNVEVSNSSLFRIASVSKPITGVAIMKLAEDGLLSLDDKVFGEGALLGTEYGAKAYSANLKNITVNHLLHHTAGGWVNDETDPMFQNLEMNNHELISWVLDNYTLSNAPGTAYAYSNFGYSLLGRIIEEVTGQSYENYVINEILGPMGINTMQIGGNTAGERISNEVKYYGQHSDNPYGHNVTRMDAHGGWIATATDLAKFLVRVDGLPSKSDVLQASTIQTMTTGSQANSSYAAGWSVNSANNWWHSGSLPGTASLIVRSSQGYNWVILCNTRAWENTFFNDLDLLIWKAVNDPNTEWPDVDLF
ncbi:serine hydrolase domain-containing protein [Rhodohalobacter sp. 614A]|uniref:serine hydrolase domain-containing protein n=1 Tax=Rhodohalobacter sp. 614A TaxID=2908649 RepID=UPI001F484B1C|nr:serine hydrolase domain-containing protein [Rhodohalobacter sp. 614A]